jgi:hypothetical protein
LDYVFVSQTIDVAETDLADTATARIASDHLPVLADIRLRERASEAVIASLDQSGRRATLQHAQGGR